METFLVKVGDVHFEVTIHVRHECRCSDPAYCARGGGRVSTDATVLSIEQLAAIMRDRAVTPL